jgi:hypothetical protein
MALNHHLGCVMLCLTHHCITLRCWAVQGHRTRVSDEFRRSKKAILFSSDVSARGVDYPDVSLVIQVRGASVATMGIIVSVQLLEPLLDMWLACPFQEHA